MNVKTHDFRKPPRLAGQLEPRLSAWLRLACQLAGQRSHHHLPFSLEFTLSAVEVIPPEEALERIPEAAVAFRAALGDEGVSLFAWPRPLALALVTGALGNASGTLPADRELTLVEESLCEYLVQQLFAAVLHETWTGPGQLSVAVGRRELSPRYSRLFASLEHLACCSLVLRGPMGEQPCFWLASPHGPLEQLTRHGRNHATPPQPDVADRLDSLVRQLPVELVVALGETELSLSQLGALKAGDLLMLKQRVSEPLVCLMDGRKKFQVWPGRVGSRQAVQVESLLG